MTRSPVPGIAVDVNDARFDLPDFGGRGVDYIMCSIPRSGSTLLAHLLRECGAMGVPHEYLHPTVHLPVLARRLQSIRQDGAVDIDSYLRSLRKRRSTANGVFGLKAHFVHLGPLMHIPSVAKLFEGARLIRVRRRDLIRQAMSYYLAEATGVWSTFDAASLAELPTPDYSGVAIAGYLLAILAEDEGWEKLLADRRSSVLNVWYEDLAAEPDSVCRSVCNHVGVHPTATFDLKRVGLQRLSSLRADEWKRRFCEEQPALVQRLTSRQAS
jgi:LPS sulfotransferase NodH